MVTINRLVDLVADIAGKSVRKRHIEGPTGVRGRKSDNCLIREKLGWSPSTVLINGLCPTYEWIRTQAMRNMQSNGQVSAVMSKELSQSPPQIDAAE
jgi:nucleoside-diphosphate-sugar epimerase